MATMEAFRKRFQEETYFDKPLGRDWVVPSLDKWVKGELAKLGGLVTRKTDIRTWKKIHSKYSSIIFEHINAIMSKGKDPSLTNSMISAMGAGQQQAHRNLGEGYIFWTEDQTGDSLRAGMQARFNAMPDSEQNCCDWLQKLSTAMHLWLIKHIVDGKMQSSLMAELAVKRTSGATFEWSHAKKLIEDQLQDFDVDFLTKAVASMLRVSGATLLEWVQMWVRLESMCTKAGVTYPPQHWCDQFLGQVSPSEKPTGKFKAIPKDAAAKATFELKAFNKEVVKLTPGLLPAYNANDPAVLEWTRRLLVHPDTLAKKRRSKSESETTDLPWEHCSDCRKKHAKGKHTSAGRRVVEAGFTRTLGRVQ